MNLRTSLRSRSWGTVLIGLTGLTLLGLAIWFAVEGTRNRSADFRDLVLEDVHGHAVPLSDYLGRPLVLHFFTTWCDQCEAMAPVLSNTSQAMSNEVQIIGVSLDLISDFQLHEGEFKSGERLADVAEFQERHSAGYPVLFDRDGKFAAAFYGHEVPVHVVLDSNLNLLRRFTGKRNEAGLRSILQACLAEDHRRTTL